MKQTAMTPSEILRKHEDANEMHFHEVDRKFIIEAMEEYAKEKSEKPINLSSKQTAVEFLIRELRIEDLAKSEQLSVVHHIINEAKAMEKEQITDAHIEGQWVFDEHPHTQWTNDQAEQYYKETYEALVTDRDVGGKIWASVLKEAIKRRNLS